MLLEDQPRCARYTCDGSDNHIREFSLKILRTKTALETECSWLDNIKIHLTEILFEVMDCTRAD